MMNSPPTSMTAPGCHTSRTPASVTRAAAVTRRGPRYSWNTIAASAKVATSSKFNSRDPVAAGIRASPATRRAGPSAPPNTTTTARAANRPEADGRRAADERPTGAQLRPLPGTGDQPAPASASRRPAVTPQEPQPRTTRLRPDSAERPDGAQTQQMSSRPLPRPGCEPDMASESGVMRSHHVPGRAGD